MKVCVVGLGEIGKAVFTELSNKGDNDVWGVDKDPTKVKGEKTSLGLVKADVYVICVYSTDQVLRVVEIVKYISKNLLIIIESTVEPKTYIKIQEIMKGKKYGLVLFPHRFNPNDSAHQVFNLFRVAGALNEQSEKRFKEFIKTYSTRIHYTSIGIAEICKPLENAISYIEIAIAEDIARQCKIREEFEKLRQMINTKWNIDLKEARDGIGGKCLPKDVLIALKKFPKFELLRKAIEVDKKYREEIE